MSARQVPGKPSWRFHDGGIFRYVLRGAGENRKTVEEELIDWCPKVVRYVVGKTVEGETIRTRYTVRVGDQERTFSQDDLRDGKAWDNFHQAAGQGDRQVCGALADIVRLQGRDLGETLDCPIWSGDQLVMPPADLMPDGYAKTSSGDPDGLSKLLGIAADNPKLALIMGFSFAAPYVAPLRRQAFVVHLNGTGGEGKTSGMWGAASLWGRPETEGSLIPSWNATMNGITGRLGRLAVLPAFLDDIHAAGFTPEKLNTTLFAITQGAGRLRADRNGEERKSRTWSGILFSSGNRSILGMLNSAGEVARRVIEISGKITTTGAQADMVKDLAQEHFGTFEPVPIAAMRDATAWAERKLAPLLTTESGVNTGIMRCLALGVAGAWHLGGEELTMAARQAAEELLVSLVSEAAEAGATMGEKLLEAARQLVVSSPNYPTRKDRAAIPADRFKPTIQGFYEHPDLYVMTTYIGEIAKHAGLADARVALRELKASGQLVTQASAKQLRRQFKVGDERFDVYHLRLGEKKNADPSGDESPFADEPTSVTSVPSVSAGQSHNQLTLVGSVTSGSSVNAGQGADSWPQGMRDTGVAAVSQETRNAVTCNDTGPAADTGSAADTGPAADTGRRVGSVTPMHRARAARVEAEAEHLEYFAKAVRKRYPDATEAQLVAGLKTFNVAMRGLNFAGPPSRVGQLLFERCEAQYGSVPVLGEPPELPRFDQTPMTMFNMIERDRAADIPALPLVIGMDVNAQFLAVTQSVALGTGPADHLPGAVLVKGEHKDLKRPGYVRVAGEVGMGPGCVIKAGRWIPNPVAEYLVARDGSLEVAERYQWAESRRWLSAWGKQASAGRRDLVARRDLPSQMALTALKLIYSTFLGGWLRSGPQTNHYNHTHTLRPDWADHVQSLARMNMLRAIAKATPKPIATYMDQAYFLVAEPHQLKGLVVDEQSLQPGKWKRATVGRSADETVIAQGDKGFTTTLARQLERGSPNGVAAVVRALGGAYRDGKATA